MCSVAVAAILVFFLCDLFVNYSMWKSEEKFPDLNRRSIREYKNKCWRGVVPLLLISVYQLFYV